MSAYFRFLGVRLVSLAIRFGCPLVILEISNADKLGEYYLFATYFTISVFLIAMELSVPFARRYLTLENSPDKRSSFSLLIVSVAIVSSVLGIPAAVMYSYLFDQASWLNIACAYAAIVVEACVNEIGRFYWNVNMPNVASVRDFFRSIFFSVGVVVSVSIEGSVLSVLFMVWIIISGLTILVIDSKKFGVGVLLAEEPLNFIKNTVSSACSNIPRDVKESSVQLAHIQLLSLIPLIERMLIESSEGLSVVGSYAFHYSLVQSGVAIVMLPQIAKARASFIHLGDLDKRQFAHRNMLYLAIQLFTVAFLFSFIAILASPFITTYMEKELYLSNSMFFAILFSVSASSYCVAVSPLFARSKRSLIANLKTAFLVSSLYILGQCTLVDEESIWNIFFIIGVASLAQIFIRALSSARWLCLNKQKAHSIGANG